MTTRRPIRLRALAKINLSLRVLGVHADGYHELRTTFQSIALHDTLTLTPSHGPLTIECDDPSCPTDDSNLVWRAAERLWRADGRRGRPTGASVSIAKRIPMQAGLGGGSSDAAAALRGFAALWRTSAAESRVRAIARELGADVAFFLDGGTALGVGRGDVLYPLPDRLSAFVVLVAPPFGVSTADAYRWWDAAHARGRLAPSTGQWHEGGGERGNDLEPPVVARHPDIGSVVKQLVARGATEAAMSGSGSVVFGTFPGEMAAMNAAASLVAPGRVVTVTRTVKRAAYRRLTAV